MLLHPSPSIPSPRVETAMVLLYAISSLGRNKTVLKAFTVLRGWPCVFGAFDSEPVRKAVQYTLLTI